MGPKDWMDAGEALGHEELKGCWMPSGAFLVLYSLSQTNH